VVSVLTVAIEEVRLLSKGGSSVLKGLLEPISL